MLVLASRQGNNLWYRFDADVGHAGFALACLRRRCWHYLMSFASVVVTLPAGTMYSAADQLCTYDLQIGTTIDLTCHGTLK